MKKILLFGVQLFILIDMVACNSGGGTSSPAPSNESYAYFSGKPYDFEYNLVNLQNISIAGDSQAPTLTCNLTNESPTCSVTIKGKIGISGGGYIGVTNPLAMPYPPVYANAGLDPCPQNPDNPNKVDCTLSFTYANGTESNSYFQGALYSLMSKNNIPQLLLSFNLYPTP